MTQHNPNKCQDCGAAVLGKRKRCPPCEKIVHDVTRDERIEKMKACAFCWAKRRYCDLHKKKAGE